MIYRSERGGWIAGLHVAGPPVTCGVGLFHSFPGAVGGGERATYTSTG